MHYIDLQKVNTKTRKGRLFGVLFVFIFAFIILMVMLNILSSQTAAVNSNLLSFISIL